MLGNYPLIASVPPSLPAPIPGAAIPVKGMGTTAAQSTAVQAAPGFQWAKFTLTQAQILAGANVTLVLGLAGFIVAPVNGCFVKRTKGAVQDWGSTTTVALHCSGTVAGSMQLTNAGNVAVSGSPLNTVEYNLFVNTGFSSVQTVPSGGGIVARFSGANTFGNGNSAEISFMWLTVPSP